MAIPASSDELIEFVDTNGNRLAAPREWSNESIGVRIPPYECRSHQLFVNGERLPLTVVYDGATEQVKASWSNRWATGSYHLELRRKPAEGPEVVRVALTFQVWPRKFSKESFSNLLLQLEMRLPAKVAVALKGLGSLSGIKILPPDQTTVAQELYRLRRAVEGSRENSGLPETLAIISKDPHRMLRASDFWVQTEFSRRLNPTGLVRVVARMGNITATTQPKFVVDTRVEHTFDVYENRVLKSYVSEVERRLRTLRRALTPLESNGGDSTEITQRIANLLKLTEGAHRASSFLEEVGHELPGGLRASMVLARRPGYRAAFKGVIELRNSLAARLDSPALESPLENVPKLYEIWATVSVLDSLLAYAKSRSFRLTQENLVVRQGDEIFVRVLAGGRPALEFKDPTGEMVVRAIPQKSYTSQGDLIAVSFLQRPDLVVEIWKGGLPSRLLIFDAKYKLDSEADGTSNSRPVKDDIDKMHAYRDAIRTKDRQLVVDYAAILYPGPYEGYGGLVEALPAVPSTSALTLTDQSSSDLYQRLDSVWVRQLG